MSTLFTSLNLSTQERRIIVVTGAVLFLLINFWLVWPRFKDWKKVQDGMASTLATLTAYQAELAKVNDNQARLKKLETAGSQVLPEDQANRLIADVQSQSVKSRLSAAGIRPLGRGAGSNVNTNRFFEEQTVEVGINPTADKDLVDFLVSIGTGASMIRVKDMQLRPDISQFKLQGKIQLVASFQKKTAAPEPAGPKVAKPDVPKSFTRVKSDSTGSVTNNVRVNPSAVRTNPPAKKP